jgi:hypothetical protein
LMFDPAKSCRFSSCVVAMLGNLVQRFSSCMVQCQYHLVFSSARNALRDLICKFHVLFSFKLGLLLKLHFLHLLCS